MRGQSGVSSSADSSPLWPWEWHAALGARQSDPHALIPQTLSIMSKPSGWLRGTVKEVLSGDTLVLAGTVRSGIPPEKKLTLASLMAPRLVRTWNQSFRSNTRWAWGTAHSCAKVAPAGVIASGSAAQWCPRDVHPTFTGSPRRVHPR